MWCHDAISKSKQTTKELRCFKGYVHWHLHLLDEFSFCWNHYWECLSNNGYLEHESVAASAGQPRIQTKSYPLKIQVNGLFNNKQCAGKRTRVRISFLAQCPRWHHKRSITVDCSVDFDTWRIFPWEVLDCKDLFGKWRYTVIISKFL